MAHIEIRYWKADGIHRFELLDGKSIIVHPDLATASGLLAALARRLSLEGSTCRIEAYSPLGSNLRLLRDAGAVCRVKLKRYGPPAPRRPKWQMPGDPVPDAPPPVFASWADYLARTTYGERMRRCHAAAKKANRKRLLSSTPKVFLRGIDVWNVIEEVKGRCFHCGSLAVENRPSAPNGAPIAWAQVGRRIGSLEHLHSRFSGDFDNEFWNLAWACLWCNTWPQERFPNAHDHGGFYPVD